MQKTWSATAKAKQGKSKNTASSFPPKSPETKKKRVKKATKLNKSKENLGDYSSDHLSEAEVSDSGVSVATPKTVSSSTSTGSRTTLLANHIEKQLIIDIENSGGIHHFDAGKKQGLRDLLDSSDFSEYYGHLGDDLRYHPSML